MCSIYENEFAVYRYEEFSVVLKSFVITSPAGAAAKYCDEYVCLCVCVSVCLSGRISLEPHARSLPIFTARRYASAVLAVVVCPSVCPSVRLSVCHKPVLYRNGNT